MHAGTLVCHEPKPSHDEQICSLLVPTPNLSCPLPPRTTTSCDQSDCFPKSRMASELGIDVSTMGFWSTLWSTPRT